MLYTVVVMTCSTSQEWIEKNHTIDAAVLANNSSASMLPFSKHVYELKPFLWCIVCTHVSQSVFAKPWKIYPEREAKKLICFSLYICALFTRVHVVTCALSVTHMRARAHGWLCGWTGVLIEYKTCQPSLVLTLTPAFFSPTFDSSAAIFLSALWSCCAQLLPHSCLPTPRKF